MSGLHIFHQYIGIPRCLEGAVTESHHKTQYNDLHTMCLLQFPTPVHHYNHRWKNKTLCNDIYMYVCWVFFFFWRFLTLSAKLFPLILWTYFSHTTWYYNLQELLTEQCKKKWCTSTGSVINTLKNQEILMYFSSLPKYYELVLKS